MRNIQSDLRTATRTLSVATRVAVLCLVAMSASCGDNVPVGGDPVPEDTVIDPDVDISVDDVADTADTPIPPDVTQTDVAGTDALDTEIADDADTTVQPDIDVGTDIQQPPKCTENPGASGCSCSSVEDCDSGFCIDTTQGQRCAGFCSEGCAADEKCISTAMGGDVVNICVPKFPKLCNPCSANVECEAPGNSGARCVDGGDNGAFCGSACTSSDDCASGYECADAKDIAGQTSKQCVVKGGAACTCSPAALTLELSTKCFTVSGDAKCEGKRTCLAAGKPGAPDQGGLTSCYAPKPDVEACDGKDNDCDGQTDEATCDDGNPCTDDVCNGAGGCQSTNKNGPCDADSTVCTKDDTCVNGKCQAGAQLACDDNNTCTKDTCDPVTGCKFTNDNTLFCDADQNACTVNDICKDGICEPGPAKACKSDDQCIEGKCNIIDGKCSYKFSEGIPCNDGSPCTAGEKCTTDTCKGTPIDCNDQNPCTGDSCDPAKGCAHGNIGGACDDNDACTGPDACKDGACVGTVQDLVKKCDDTNACTIDSCDKVKGCVNAPANQGACDDGNVCTEGDSCQAGKCVSGSNKCGCINDGECVKYEDGNACNGTLYCDKSAPPYQCKINPNTVVKCDESLNNACQTNTCDPALGKCGLNKKQNGLGCDADGTICTEGDACLDGQCAPGKVANCNDNNPCTDDSCNAKIGCVYQPNAIACDADGNKCTQNDACSGGVCVAGAKKLCEDNEECTENSCDSATGDCKFINLVKPCSDNNLCTTGDACANDPVTSKYTCVPGKALPCDDSKPCTKDTCDASKGCIFTPDATLKVACYTGDPATKNKGQCKEGTQQCKVDGTLDVCKDEVLPGPKELCDGVDNDCDGTMDEGCAPTGFTARYGAAVVTGSGPKYGARVFAGGSVVAGKAAGAKYTADLGFYAWLKAFLGI
ncbi:MAG: hypothetical protein ACOYOB_08685 [Myxococcota bacterium]